MSFVPFDHVPPHQAQAPAHAHTTPVFGCDKCIRSDRAAWEKRQYDKFVSTYARGAKRFCPRHLTVPMRPYTYLEHEGKLKAVLTCDTLTDEGEFRCEDHDVFVEIENL